MTVAQNRWAELITMLPTGNDTLPYFKISRELFDRAKYSSLQVQQMVWSRGLNIEDYNTFIYQNNTLDYIPCTLNIISCYLNGPIIVAIHISTKTSIQAILLALTRTQILPNRLY